MYLLKGESLGDKMDRAYKRHNPRVFNSPVLLVLAETRREYPDDPIIRINELRQFLRGDIEAHVIKGKHLDILKEPNVGEIADLINDYLKR